MTARPTNATTSQRIFYISLLCSLRQMAVVGQSTVYLNGGSQTNYNSGTCDFLFDRCPYQFDDICDDPSQDPTAPVAQAHPDCSDGGDCFDCDPCHQYNFDCTSCLANNCLWCEENAFCSSVALDQNYYNLRFGGDMFIGCITQQDWSFGDDATCGGVATNNNNGNVWNDPLYDAQEWVYDVMNVQDAWNQGWTGEGIHIRINDMGVDTSHPDLQGKIDVDNSCAVYEPLDAEQHHGTWAAVVAGANANNGECSAGVAPDASLSSCNVFLDPDITEQGAGSNNDGSPQSGGLFTSDADALAGDRVIQNVDISSNSWGFPTCTSPYAVNFGQRKLQWLQLEQQRCPFQNAENVNGFTSPCEVCDEFIPTSTSATANDLSFASTLSNQCQRAIITYCAYPPNFENDIEACTEYLDLYVDCEYNALQQHELNALARGVTQGRNGLGIIYLFASGNDYNSGADTNFEGWLNTRFTMSVGSVGKFGYHASYSTAGAALFVVGPGGDVNFVTNHVGCEHIGMGTSFASPAIAGGIALILQSNPNLSWRDIQGIIALTSTMTDPTHESWTVNAANFHHSYLYGFGILNVGAAVTVAQNWNNYHLQEQTIVVNSDTLGIPLLDYSSNAVSNTVTTTLTVNRNDVLNNTFVIETVYVYIDLYHVSRGDLNIILTSPTGTESLIHPAKRPENQVLAQHWKLMTVRNWGESPLGDWTLSITDESVGDFVADNNNQDRCVDLPWETTITNGDITCALVESNGFCYAGRVMQPLLLQFPNRDTGVTADTACCICGGGQSPDDVVDELNSWRLVIYGHYSDTPEQQVHGYSDGGDNITPTNTNPANTGDETPPQQDDATTPQQPQDTFQGPDERQEAPGAQGELQDDSPEDAGAAAAASDLDLSTTPSPTNPPQQAPMDDAYEPSSSSSSSTNDDSVPEPVVGPSSFVPTITPSRIYDENQVPTIDNDNLIKPSRKPFLDRITGRGDDDSSAFGNKNGMTIPAIIVGATLLLLQL